jgi:hypothetical protein
LRSIFATEEQALDPMLVDELNMVIVTTSCPFWLEHSGRSWKHEKAIITMVSEFINSIPNHIPHNPYLPLDQFELGQGLIILYPLLRQLALIFHSPLKI